MLQKISVSNKCCSFEHFMHQIILKKCIMISTKILCSAAVFNIDNNKHLVSCASKQHIRMIMIYEWSHDTESGVKAAENGIKYILKCKQKTFILNCFDIFYSVTVFTVFLVFVFYCIWIIFCLVLHITVKCISNSLYLSSRCQSMGQWQEGSLRKRSSDILVKL